MFLYSQRLPKLLDLYDFTYNKIYNIIINTETFSLIYIYVIDYNMCNKNVKTQYLYATCGETCRTL